MGQPRRKPNSGSGKSRHATPSQAPSKSPAPLATSTSKRDRGPGDELRERVRALLASKNYEKALGVLQASGQDRDLSDVRGVCLMRLGRFEEAIRLYHGLVLSPGCTWMRSDIPISVKTNYATALLIGGRVSGSQVVLDEINAEKDEQVIKLRQSIRQWASSLSFWQRLNWRFCKIAPAKSQVALDFEPGRLSVDLVATT